MPDDKTKLVGMVVCFGVAVACEVAVPATDLGLMLTIWLAGGMVAYAIQDRGRDA